MLYLFLKAQNMPNTCALISLLTSLWNGCFSVSKNCIHSWSPRQSVNSPLLWVTGTALQQSWLLTACYQLWIDKRWGALQYKSFQISWVLDWYSTLERNPRVWGWLTRADIQLLREEWRVGKQKCFKNISDGKQSYWWLKCETISVRANTDSLTQLSESIVSDSVYIKL